MLKSWKFRLARVGVAFAVIPVLASQPVAAQDVLGPDAAACRPGAEGPAVQVRVHGFKDRGGMLRVQLYGDKPEEFLAKGTKLKRIEMPMTASGDMVVCMALPEPGTYAIAVRHDRDGNGKSGWSDGGGFSGNPAISLMHLRPTHQSAAFSVKSGVKPVDIVMNYKRGLLGGIGPVVPDRK